MLRCARQLGRARPRALATLLLPSAQCFTLHISGLRERQAWDHQASSYMQSST